MRTRTFLLFVLPSLVLMLAFLAVPLVVVAWQSLHVTQKVIKPVEVEICSAGLFKKTCHRRIEPRPILDAQGRPLTQTHFVGLDNFRTILAVERLKKAWQAGFVTFRQTLASLDFYRALRFTLTFTLITLPFVLGFGLMLALCVNTITRAWKGPVIFMTLLPLIVTPLVGVLSIRWLFVGNGLITSWLEWLLEKDLAVFAHGWAVELLMISYRIWHATPLAFIIIFAALQTQPRDVQEAALIDGASRFQRLRFIIIPHLKPVLIFVALIHLMDAYRVFEEVVGFSSQAHRISLQWLTYQFLHPDLSGHRAIASASTSAILTIIGIMVILIPLIKQTWRDHHKSNS